MVSAMEQAECALSWLLFISEQTNEEIPEPTDLRNLDLEDSDLGTLVSCDTDDFRKRTDNAPVERTVRIPAWQSYLVDKAGIDLSEFLESQLGLNLVLCKNNNASNLDDLDTCDDEDWDDEDDEELEDEEDDLQTYYDFAFDGAVVCNVTFKTPTDVYTATIICSDGKDIDEKRLKLLFDDAAKSLDLSTCDTFEDAIDYIRNCLKSDYGCETAVIYSDFAALFITADKPTEDNKEKQ